MFGCLGYATNIVPHKGKFETRAHKCVFIGFTPRQKGFKLYNLDTRHVMMSRDVVFYENVFPFKEPTEQMTENNESPLPIINDATPNLDSPTSDIATGNEEVNESHQ